MRAIMRESPRRTCRWCNRAAHGKAALCKQALGIGQQGILTAKQMRRTSDIDQHTIGRINRAPRSPSLCPQRQLLQKGEISLWVCGCGGEAWANRAGIGEQAAQLHASVFAGMVERLHTRTMRGFRNQRERSGIRSLALCQTLS